MTDLSSLTAAQLKKAADLKDRIEALSAELAEILGATESVPTSEPIKPRKKYKLSAVGRAKKVAAQKARWAKVKVKTEAKPVKKRRKMSAASKAKIAAAAKARWAKVKREKPAM